MLRDKAFEIHEKMVALLWSLFGGREEKAIANFAKRVGWTRGKIYRSRQRKNGFYFWEVIFVLQGLDVSPRWFFSRLFGRGSSLKDFIVEGQLLRQKLKVELPEVELASLRGSRSRSVAARLDELKPIIFTNGEFAERKVWRLVSDAATEGSSDDVLEAVMWLAKAYQYQDKLGHSHACLAWALEAGVGSKVYFEILIAAALLLIDYGDFSDAIEFSDKSLAISVERRTFAGLAQGLAVKAQALWRLARGDEALIALESAIQYAPEDSARLRCAIYHALGLVSEGRGDLEKAEKYATEAVREAPPSVAKGSLYWLLARIAAARRDWVKAEELYRQALDLLAPSSVTTAEAACELALVLYRAGKPGKAGELATSLLSLLKSQKNPVVHGIVSDLALAAVRGVLNQKRVEDALSAIRATPAPMRMALPIDYP
ncbi:MAG: hypothetical protein D6692_04655 [Planctomycetota bacterium]|nr:MAG: hypothetical protein D6692_04655 [Planctomycetota bacterium]